MTESNASDPWPALLRLLAVRDRSAQELRDRLARKGFAAAAIDAALARARQAGYLDDGRFARLRAGQLAASGRASGPRLRQELSRSGLAEEDVEAAAREALAQHPPDAVLRALLARRFAGFDFHAAPPAEQGRVVRFFQRRGFPLALILSILKEEER